MHIRPAWVRRWPCILLRPSSNSTSDLERTPPLRCVDYIPSRENTAAIGVTTQRSAKTRGRRHVKKGAGGGSEDIYRTTGEGRVNKRGISYRAAHIRRDDEDAIRGDSEGRHAESARREQRDTALPNNNKAIRSEDSAAETRSPYSEAFRNTYEIRSLR